MTVVNCITEGAGSGFVALLLFTAIRASVIVCAYGRVECTVNAFCRVATETLEMRE